MKINSKEYWDKRFSSGNWNWRGRKQTREYALSNVLQISISKDFIGSILDFGCAMGDAIPVYSEAYPKAKIFGIDISESAIERCKNRFGDIAEFFSGDHTKVSFKDIIFASHVMEHLPEDKNIVKDLLSKCNDLYVFVPYKEEPLYFEHIHYYNEYYYNDFNVFSKKKFNVSYRQRLPLKSIIKNFLRLKFLTYSNFSKEIIMFHFKGTYPSCEQN